MESKGACGKLFMRGTFTVLLGSPKSLYFQVCQRIEIVCFQSLTDEAVIGINVD